MTGKCKMTGNETMLPCSAAGCPLFGDCLVEYEKAVKKPQTKGDRIRSMSDEELASKIYEVLMCQIDPTKAFCDGKAGCISPEGNIDCNADKIKACIIRYLQQPAEEATHEQS